MPIVTYPCKHEIALKNRKDLADLLTENFAVSESGVLKPAEVLRLREEYGIDVRTDYNFATTRELRLTCGLTVRFDGLRGAHD